LPRLGTTATHDAVDARGGLALADKSIAAEHATARPGVALLSAPGVSLRRFCAPLTTYRQHHGEVTGTGQPGSA
jgi:hypothetical protein